MSSQDEIWKIEQQGRVKELKALTRHLNILREQRAIVGIIVPPGIIIAIEDIEKKVSELQSILDLQNSQQPSRTSSTGDVNNLITDLHWEIHDLKNTMQQEHAEMYTEAQNILLAIQQGRMEQGEVVQLVESLRHWALDVQRRGLPTDPELCQRISRLAEKPTNDDERAAYLRVSIPIIPEILKIESDVNLNGIWKDIKRKLGMS